MASTAQKIRDVREVAIDQGWRIDRMSNGHLKWTPPSPEAEMVVTSGLTSNWNYRSFNNALSQLRRSGLTYPAVGASQRIDAMIAKLTAQEEEPMALTQEPTKVHAAAPRFEILELPEEPGKRCTKCQEVKPKSAFALKTSDPSGRQSWCKTCHSEHEKAKGPRHRSAASQEAAPAPVADQASAPEPTPSDPPEAPPEEAEAQPTGLTLAEVASALDAAVAMIEELADSFVEHKRAVSEASQDLREALGKLAETVATQSGWCAEAEEAILARLEVVEAKAANIDPIASFRARLGR